MSYKKQFKFPYKERGLFSRLKISKLYTAYILAIQIKFNFNKWGAVLEESKWLKVNKIRNLAPRLSLLSLAPIICYFRHIILFLIQQHRIPDFIYLLIMCLLSKLLLKCPISLLYLKRQVKHMLIPS